MRNEILISGKERLRVRITFDGANIWIAMQTPTISVRQYVQQDVQFLAKLREGASLKLELQRT